MNLLSSKHSNPNHYRVETMAESSQEQSTSMNYGTRSIYVAILVISLFTAIPISKFLIPRLVSVVGQILGFYLRRKTAGRRAQILERAEEEEQSFSADGGKRRDSDEEWENVESYAVGTSENGKAAAKDWDGIVGFFHPFWYLFVVLVLRRFYP
jgi:alpha-1,2-mannosyltransferase